MIVHKVDVSIPIMYSVLLHSIKGVKHAIDAVLAQLWLQCVYLALINRKIKFLFNG